MRGAQDEDTLLSRARPQLLANELFCVFWRPLQVLEGGTHETLALKLSVSCPSILLEGVNEGYENTMPR